MTAADILETHTCEIVEDLLPLYAKEHQKQPGCMDTNSTDPLVSAFVKEHIKDCPACRSLLELLQEDFPQPEPDCMDIPPIPFQHKYHIRLALGTACAIFAATGVLALLI